MTQPQHTPSGDDGIEDDLRRMFQQARTSAANARARRLSLLDRRARAGVGGGRHRLGSSSRSSTKLTAREEALARLVAAVETRRHIENYQKEAAGEAEQRDAERRREIADKHVESWRERAAALGVSTATLAAVVGYALAEEGALERDAAATAQAEHEADLQEQREISRSEGLDAQTAEISDAAATYTDEAIDAAENWDLTDTKPSGDLLADADAGIEEPPAEEADVEVDANLDHAAVYELPDLHADREGGAEL